MSADKDEIRDRSDIVEIIGASVMLQKKGRNYLGLCPFHQEKTPSFNVDPQTRTFICFGCGEKGDVFTFVQKHQNMSFIEATEFLAKRAGLVFERKGSKSSPEQISQREQIFEINATAARFFQNALDKVTFAKDYLAGRGLTPETISQFQIGYAPNDWEALADFLRANRKDMRIAELAGLVKPGTTSPFIDMFRNRIIFPIHDEQQRIVGFGGRAFGDDQPKYLNTGETPVFNKSRLLYGLPFARKRIGEEQRTLLMEGYMDVVAAHQGGFVNAVATLGTSLTDEHAKKLSRLAPTVVLVYDADAAGIKATLRASEILENEEVNVRVVRLPKGEDPDSLLKNGEVDAFRAAITDSVTRVDYLIEYALLRSDSNTAEGRIGFLRDLYRILANVRDPLICDAQFIKFAKLHPYAVHGLPSAVSQMRNELAERRRGKGGAPKIQVTSVDPTAIAMPLQEDLRALKLLADLNPSDSPRRRAIVSQLKKAKFAPSPEVKPLTSGTGGLSAELRAERELMRAMALLDWQKTVLQSVSREEFPTDMGRRFRDFVEQNLSTLQSDETNLVDLLVRHNDEDFSLSVRQLLQEINAQMEKVPVTNALIQGCAATLKHHRKELVKQEIALMLQSKPALDPEDRERVDEHMKLVRELKGSAVSQA